MRKIILLFIIYLLCCYESFSQDFSNKGKDFWVGYGNHIRMFNPGNPVAPEAMQIYLTSDVNTTGNVTIASIGFSQIFNVIANQITVVSIPRTAALLDEGLYNHGIHITALKPIVAYGFIYVNAISGATVYLPTNTLGKEYYSLNFRQISNELNSYSYFFVEATEPGSTIVEIKPSQTTKGGWPANVTQTITLTQGQIYQVLSSTDLTGSTVKSIASGTGGCKKIAVFCGSNKISIGCAAVGSTSTAVGSSDNLYQQMYPTSTWGKKYVLIPSENKLAAPLPIINTNIFRIYRPDASAIVTLNGVIISPGSFINNCYDFQNNQTNLVESSKGILVSQYFTSANSSTPAVMCPSGNGNPHDPEMIYLNPIEQTITDVTVNSMQPSSNTAITQHFINVVLRNAGTGVTSFKIDGAFPPASAFTVLPQDNSYSYIRIWKNGGSTTLTDPNLSPGAHRLTCDSGFNAIAYGFGNAESYGYSAGTNLKDLFQQISVQSQFGIETSPSVCTNSPFRFRVSLPYCADSIEWDLSLLPGPPTPTNPKIRYSSCLTGLNGPDSTTVVNGKVIYWYSLPNIYNFPTAGLFPVTITAYNTGATQCGSSQDIEFELGVFDPPNAGFRNNQPGCVGEPVQFIDTTVSFKPNYQWAWNFGDPGSGSMNTSNVQNPVHVFSIGGPHTVTLSTTTTVGCISSIGTKLINVPFLVNAVISGTVTVCQNSPPVNIDFTITDGLPPYKINYSLSVNGGAAVAQTPIITSSLINSIAVSTSTAGTYTYSLSSIENANTAFCTRLIAGQTATVTVAPLPSAAISGNSTVCQNSASPIITFIGNGGTAPYSFNYTLNGSPQSVTSIGNNAIVNVPTNVSGTFTYIVASVSDASSTNCLFTYTSNQPTAVVEVQQTPNATISGTLTVCKDAVAPIITFTGSNGTAPYQFTFNINGGASQTITTTAFSNIATLTVPMTTTGTFIYNLVSVQAAGSIVCANPISGAAATIIINPLPTATITGSTTVCQNTGSQNVTFTGGNATGPYTFGYNINGGATQTVTTTSGNSVNIAAPSTTVGTFIYSLLSVTDASSTLCTQNYSTNNTATIIVQATSTATINGNTTVCQNSTAPIITFTGFNGNAPFTFTYNINGGATQTISTSGTANTVTLVAPITTFGTFVYNLLSVKNTGPILCLTPITGANATVVINPVPTATISGTTTVCQNTTSPNITFTGANASAPYTFTYTINNGTPQTITTTNGNSITIAAPTNLPGIFVYSITQVKDASSTQCIRTYANTNATVTVKQLASANITGTVSVCQSSATPNVVFTAVGGVAPYTFSYTLNGTASTITTTTGSTVSIGASTAIPGTYTYVLQSVQESSSVACTQLQSGTVTITVRPKPTASFTTTGPYCAQNTINVNPAFAITPTGSIVSWIWDYGDGVGPQTRPNGNPFTLTYPTAGIKNISFKTVSDLGCESNVFLLPVMINSKPVAGFINPGACLADAQAQFTDTTTVAGAGASIVYWEWDFGDGTPVFAGSGPTHKNPLHSYLVVGQKTVKLIVTSNSGCKDTVIQQFFINGEVTRAEFTILNPNNLCSNRPVQIRENSIVNVGGLIRTDIYWNYIGTPTVFDQDNSPTPGKIYTHNYPNLQTDQTYSIRYFAYSGFNGVCQKDTTITITVRASPVAQFITVPDVCLNGGPVVLSQGSASGGTGVYMGPGVTFNAGVYTFNPLSTGVSVGTNNGVIYTVTSPAGCDSAKVQQIKVLAPPIVNTFTPVGNICHNNSITFHQTSTMGDGVILKWIYNWNDGSTIQVMTNGGDVTHVYTTTGSHTATLTLETAYGCRNIPFSTQPFTVNPLPFPSYTFSNSVCLPAANILFTNTTPNTGAHTYLWSFELPSALPANTSTLINPSHIYTTQGPFNTHLIATNIATGCVDSSAVVTINSNTIHPAPVLQFNNIPDVCLNNGIVSFLALASETSGIAGGPGIFTGTGIVSANGDFNPLIAGVGTHTITYTWTSSFNCPTSTTKNVNVLVAPVADFATVGNTCQNSAITFHQTSTASVGTIVQWIYDWGDGTPTQTFTNGNDQTHVYTTSPSTPFVATLTVITNGGCKSTPKQVNVTVNPQPLPDFTFTASACLPQARIDFLNITPPSLSTWSYKWYFVQNPTSIQDSSTSQSPNHIYTSVGPHTVKLISTSPVTGCTNSIIKQVNTIHKAPVASFNFDKPSICVAQNVNVLQNSTAEEGTLSTWNWNYGDNSNAVGQSPLPHTYNAMGTYNVSLNVTNSFGCVDDSTKPFVVYPYPVLDAGPDDVVLEGGTFNIVATATGNNLTYLWSSNPSPTYLTSITILNPVAKPVVDITYKLTVTAQGGCTKADSVFIKVLKFPEIPNTFTPNNDGIHDFWEIKYLFTYPGNKVQVFTRTGQLVFQSKGYAKPWDGNMNGKPLPFDTYYYIIEPGSGRKPVTGYVTIVK